MPHWRNKIYIKDMFSDDCDDKNVLEICNSIIPQLERVFKKEQKILEENDLNWTFEEIIEDFKFVKSGIENNEDSEEYDFDNWTEAFNEYLNKLYDLADETIIKKDFFNDEKLLWVG